MIRFAAAALTLLVAVSGAAAASAAPPPAEPASKPAPSTAALAFLDGVWIGPARMTGRDGKTHTFEQMERVGPMIGGQIRLMEGKARDPGGAALFNALTVFSQRPDGSLEMRSHTTEGGEGVRTINLTAGPGFVWEHRLSPSRVIRYEATVTASTWSETGVVVTDGVAAPPFFTMTLTRKGDIRWPAANPDFPTTGF